MEDRGGDIIFYIIAGIIAIVSALGNKRKKKQAASPTGDDAVRKKRRFEEILEDLISEPVEESDAEVFSDYQKPESDNLEFDEAVESPVEDNGVQEEYTNPEFEHTPQDISALDEDGLTIDGIAATFMSVDESDQTESYRISDPDSWASQLADEFDLPKAIIYSEILNRKDNF